MSPPLSAEHKCESVLSRRARAFSVESLIGETEPSNRSADKGKSSHTEASVSQHSVFSREWHSYGHKDTAVSVELCSRDLWRKFHRLGTEMIITKAGRRMFPPIKLRLGGLDPVQNYIVFMDIIPLDNKRYRYIYHSSEWSVAGRGETPVCWTPYIHPMSPASGQVWMDQGVAGFDKLKLTNNRKSELIGQITRLKIASNPFAKGFREAYKPRKGQDIQLPSVLGVLHHSISDFQSYFFSQRKICYGYPLLTDPSRNIHLSPFSHQHCEIAHMDEKSTTAKYKHGIQSFPEQGCTSCGADCTA